MRRLVEIFIDWQYANGEWDCYRTTVRVGGKSIKHCLDKALTIGYRIPCYADRVSAGIKVGMEATDKGETR